MGYSTYHEIVDIEPASEEETVKAAIEATKDTEDEEIYYAIGQNPDWCKWYDCEEDMKKFSKRFPNVAITISGEGEESPDFWKSRFKNGECETVYGEVVYPPFKEIK